MADVSGVSNTAPSWTGAVTANTNAKKQSTLDMSGFLKIMAAQMKNQSMDSSSTDNSQYITQMAMFSVIQAMNTMSAQSAQQYGASLIGSNVVLKVMDSNGNATQVNGTVEKAGFNQSGTYLLLKGKGDQVFNLSDVIEVDGSAQIAANQTPTGGDTTSGSSDGSTPKA